MSTPILYLDALLLASTVYPSGFSYSLFTSWSGAPSKGSTAFLTFLALPYLIVCPALWLLHPGFLAVRDTTALLVIGALLMIPLVLGIEYVTHGTAMYLTKGSFPKWFSVHRFWSDRLSVRDHILLWVIVVGEEFIYRALWFGVLHRSFGFSIPVAVAVSSLAYGLNHLSFGGISVLSKTVSGVFYASVYLLGAECILLPILTHGLQNVTLFGLARKRYV
jgi:hypothetical protein